MSADVLSYVLRALGFIALFQAAGGAFFASLFPQVMPHVRERLRHLALSAAIVAMACFALQQSLEAGRFVGEVSGVLQWDLLVLAWNSPSGLGQVLRLSGLLLIVIGFRTNTAPGAWTASCGAALALLAFLASGHTSVDPWRPLLAPLLAVHVLVAAFWFGSLMPLLLVSRHEVADSAAAILARFSVLAGWSVPLILIAGLAIVLALAPDLSVLQRTYGQLVLLKLAVFLVLLLLATYNRWRLVPWISQGRPQALIALRRSITVEVALIAGVLAVTAALTLFFSPEG